MEESEVQNEGIEIKEEPIDYDCNNDFEFTNDQQSPTFQRNINFMVKLENFAWNSDPVNDNSISVGSEHCQEKSRYNPKMLMKLRTSKYPIVLVKKLKNLRCGVGYDVKLYEDAPVDSDVEEIKEQTFSRFIRKNPKSKFRCLACSFVTKRKYDAIRHSLTHLDIKLYQCVDCSYESNYKERYEIHLMKHNTPFPSVDREKVIEQAVSTKFAPVDDDDYDDSESVTKQAVSTSFASDDDDRKRIMEQTFSQFILTTSKNQFKCLACGYITKNKGHATFHSLIHSDIKLYKCVDCDYQNNYKHKYEIHLKKHNTAFPPVDNERVKEESVSTPFAPVDDDSERVNDEAISTPLDPVDDDSERVKEQAISPLDPNDNDSEKIVKRAISTSISAVDIDRKRIMEQIFSQFILTISKNKFKCLDCGYVAKEKRHAIRHSLIHSDIKLYKCTYCNYETNRKDRYRIHSEKHSATFAPVDNNSERDEEQAISTPFDPVDGDSERVKEQAFSTPFDPVDDDRMRVAKKVFSKFMLTISKGKFKCLACGYVTETKSHARRHSLTHSDVKFYKCIYCNYETNYKFRYQIHLKTKHFTSFFKCKICDFTTSQKHLMDKHNASHQSQKNRKRSNPNNQVLHHSSLKNTNNCEMELSESRFSKITRYVDGDFICAICDYKTESRAGAQRHSVVHTDMWYSCSKCDCEFIGKDVYETHIKDYHENKSLFKCGDCDFTCDVIKEYYSHVSSHTKVNQQDPVDVMEELYSCDKCNYKTRYRNRLIRHNRVHISHKNLHKRILDSKSSDPYEAQLDKNLYDFSDSIIERDGHVFKCSLCTYVSLYKYRVRRHCLIHSETKFYKCINCKFETNRKYQYKKHIRKMHSDKYKGSSTAFSIESSNDTEELYSISESKIDDIKYESNVNYVSYIEEETLPLIYCETELVAENPEEEDAEPFMIGHKKCESPELISADDGIVDPFLMENECSLVNNTLDNLISVVEN